MNEAKCQGYNDCGGGHRDYCRRKAEWDVNGEYFCWEHAVYELSADNQRLRRLLEKGELTDDR